MDPFQKTQSSRSIKARAWAALLTTQVKAASPLITWKVAEISSGKWAPDILVVDTLMERLILRDLKKTPIAKM